MKYLCYERHATAVIKNEVTYSNLYIQYFKTYFSEIQNAFPKSAGFDYSYVTDGSTSINARCSKSEKKTSKLLYWRMMLLFFSRRGLDYTKQMGAWSQLKRNMSRRVER